MDPKPLPSLTQQKSNLNIGNFFVLPKTFRTKSIENQHGHLLPSDEQERGFNQEEPKKMWDFKNDLVAYKALLFGSYFNLLLVFLPFGFLSYSLDWSSTATFFLNFLAMIPLASVLGDATEALAEHLGETIGGLLNATFGNAVEIVVMIIALVKAKAKASQRTVLLRVVQTSLIGSIFSNSLLVLGCAFVANGIYYSESSFNATATTANVSLLMIASFVMILPSPYSQQSYEHDELMVSRAAAIILLIMYGFLLFFVLRTHSHIMNPEEVPLKPITQEAKTDRVNDAPGHAEYPNDYAIESNQFKKEEKTHDHDHHDHDDHHEEEEEDDHLPLSLVGSAILLFTATTIVAVLSEFLVGSIEPMSTKLGMSEAFVGIILLPIIGNGVEHITAIRMALKNKMDIAISIAIGSATQVAMFVVGLAIIIAWMLDLSLSLNFPNFEVQLFIYSSIILFALICDGSSNWLEGAMLLCLYVLIAVAVWDQELD